MNFSEKRKACDPKLRIETLHLYFLSLRKPREENAGTEKNVMRSIGPFFFLSKITDVTISFLKKCDVSFAG